MYAAILAKTVEPQWQRVINDTFENLSRVEVAPVNPGKARSASGRQ
jgi:hypothetical protein